MHCLPRNATRFRFVPVALATVLLLATAACGSDDDANRAVAGDDGDGEAGGTASALPAPEGAIGSVTGMPANPGPGTSRIVPVEPAVGDTSPVESAAADYTWSDGADAGDVAAIGRPDVQAPRPEVDDPLAEAPPLIIVPEVPVPPVAIDDGMRDPEASRDARDATTTTRPPIGTEAATESTTIVIEPDDTGGSR